jgi:membrane-associated phospholipid phosphatase
MFKSIATLALTCASLAFQIASASTVQNQQAAVAGSQVNPVIEWNRTLLVIVRTQGAQPPTIHSTRNFAMLHAAIYDAVDNITGDFTPYLVRLPDASRKASQPAAADKAAHDVLVSLYPAFQSTLDTELQTDLAGIPNGKPKTDGIAIGKAVAVQILAFRSNDGSGATPPVYQPIDRPGFYQLTPPDFSPADFTHWPNVTPFAIARADEFLPGPPPVLTSDQYTGAFNEVKSLGESDSKTRTLDETQIGQFWNGKIQNYWNEIAQTAALGHHLGLEQSARLFALLDISLADTTIAFFEAKYFYQVWRPVTAVQNADKDGNPDTGADADWLPLTTKTAPDPSYPGAHSAISAAGAQVLTFYFGNKFTFDVTSEVLPSLTRHFTSFSAAAQEAGFSRIFAGQHFPTDHTAGKVLGQAVAESIDETILLPQ